MASKPLKVRLSELEGRAIPHERREFLKALEVLMAPAREAGLTQQRIADELGCKPPKVSKLFHGELVFAWDRHIERLIALVDVWVPAHKVTPDQRDELFLLFHAIVGTDTSLGRLQDERRRLAEENDALMARNLRLQGDLGRARVLLERGRGERTAVEVGAADGDPTGRHTRPAPLRAAPEPPPYFGVSAGIGPRLAARDLLPALTEYLASAEEHLIGFRRDLHAHAELGHQETRTTGVLKDWLGSVGLSPTVLPKGTGLICDIGSEDGPIIALRAGIDALPVVDRKDVPYRSTNPGVCHDVGNDVQATIILGVGMFLAQNTYLGLLPGRIRLLFQPAAEQIPGGALDMIAAGGIRDVRRIFALQCDPWTEVGRIALSAGAMTAACDTIVIRLAHPGPEAMTATAKLMTEIPAALATWGFPNPSRLGLVWERISGDVDTGVPVRVEGRLWCLDDEAWREAPEEVSRLLQVSAEMYRAKWELEHCRGDRVVVNEPTSVKLLADAATTVLGRGSVVAAPQRLVRDGFGWYLESIPGALARLGVRRPGTWEQYPVRGHSDVDEQCIGAGIKLMVATMVNVFNAEID